MRSRAASITAASPRTAAAGAVRARRTATPARARWRAITNPSPPLAPPPEAAATGARTSAAVSSDGNSTTPGSGRDRLAQLDDGGVHTDHHGARDQAMPDVQLLQADQRRDRPDVAVIEAMPGAQMHARVGRGARRQLQALQLARDLRPARRREAVVA